MTRALVLIVIGFVGSVLLSGCTPSVSPGPESSATPGSNTDAVTTIDMPDLGPSPAPDHLPDDGLEQLRLVQQDIDWRPVAHIYPDSVRPVVAFEDYTDEDVYLETLHKCYTASGLRLGMKVNEIGETVVNDAEAGNEAQSRVKFVCRATVTLRPEPWNAAQIGYHYDYLTEFLAPCYAANGIENSPAPARAEYIANWPNPGWAPEMDERFATPAAAALIAACPGPFD